MLENEHKPWVGERYANQPEGERYLIAGFSHWGRYSDEREDDPDFTNQVMRRWGVPGSIRFFDSIASYFGSDDRNAFWNSVCFINTLPTTVGSEDERYTEGTPEQRTEAPARNLRILDELRPDKVLLFSRKAWPLWPEWTGSLTGATIGIKPAEINFGSYKRSDGGESVLFGLRHPQFASSSEMKDAVRAVREHRSASRSS